MDLVRRSLDASASLRSQNLPQLQGLAHAIDTTSRQIARGDLPRFKREIGNLEHSIPSVPDLPSIPSAPVRPGGRR